MRRLATLAALTVLTSLAGAGSAVAQESHFHAGIAVGHALGDPQQSEFGFGGQVGMTYELRFAKIIGIEASIDVYDMSQGSPPSNPAFAQHGQGFGVDGLLGARWRPFGAKQKAGLWVEAGAGAGAAGSALRPIFEGRIGYDVRVKKPAWEVGPFIGYTEVFQPSDTLRPEDAHLLWAGIHVDLEPHGDPGRPDRDYDGVFDDEDACPYVKGVRTSDPKTNGCPPAAEPPKLDRDGDGILDGVDACPDTPGIKTDDPRTNGCPPPPPDRDKDGVPDSEDACPDVPGVRTIDPRTNGCPLPPDRDKDTVLDADDACPDIPGVHTENPKTNGCPAASQAVRVEGDEILLNDVIHFETGSPRVRHASWPLVKQVADYIEGNKNITHIDIEGHADDVGTAAYNLYLSKERAKSVMALLVHFGVDPKKLSEHAYGESRPVAPGHDPTSRQENRRVEFTIVNAVPEETPPKPQTPGAKPNGGP